ncbi:MAG TPA: DNA-3-methyladenine glycosylase [Jatrophihabitans sp.]|uniref:DNA-3-methyladenine glycosylase n=1 Tax=Jatrophihabitans sp. TaxID=1932789 RepID=UPI002DFD973A|nr:DNA-3-methyladenine glycosylase [Jatrophihabitans sp.]
MTPPIDRERLRRPALALAPRLLGAVVVSDVGGVEVAVRLTEVEAYEGADDPASHAFRGRTPRTAVMFGPPGHLYCYFTYGMHWCANVVCGTDDVAAAVLLRAGEVVRGAETAQERRPASRRGSDLARGPARLASCLGLDAATNGVDLCDPGSPVRIERLPGRRRPGVVAGPRVGIAAAAERPWRFWLPDEPTVSPFKTGGRKRRSAAPAD